VVNQKGEIMKVLRIILIMMMFISFNINSVFADDIADLKAMVEDMRNDYEVKIKMLENKIDRLELSQEKQVEDKVAKMRVNLKEEIKSKGLGVDYVGRHNAPVGDGGLVVENPFGFGNVSLGGYMDMEYRDLDNLESTFRQHRWIINIGAQPHERIRFNSELEIDYGGPDTAGADGELKVEQAYVDYLINDYINVRAGAVLTPFGRYNLYHDSDLQDLTDRPLMARDIVPTTWTEAGYGLFGEFDPVIGEYEDLLVNYEIYVVNGLDDGFSDTGFRGARNSLKTDNNDNKSIVGRLSLSPFLGHEIGLSGYRGEYGSTNDVLLGGAVDTFSTVGPFELISELAYFDVEESPTAASDLANYLYGGYVQLNYHFWPEFLNDTFLGEKFESPTFTLVGRYGWAEIHDDSDATIGNNKEQRTTLGFNYRPIDSFVVKFEYQFNETDNETLEAGDGDGFITSVALGF
jgi:hypothetical protein